ncbi:hypothetical protein CFOL_v3_21515 [Cephalotus follicularis]|uniref:Uncharacterized protein n=1 Tax=Cephalotus follicularis TaxID=3775 RepID=A0A1Q3CCV3_CEPFO|nr:hypothetical protein CFOL_v3_21515 [Cephalotus follicularis]
MEKMQSVLKQSYVVKEYMLDVNDLCAHPNVILPAKLKMDDGEKFDGNGHPKSHLRQYVSTMKPRDLTKEQLTTVFSRSLTGPAARWYLHRISRKQGHGKK